MTLIQRIQTDWDQKVIAFAIEFTSLTSEERQARIDELARLDQLITNVEAAINGPEKKEQPQ